MSASHAHSASFPIVRLSWKQPECPWTGDAWTKVPLPPSLTGILFNPEKSEISLCVTALRELSEGDSEREIVYGFTYMWNLKPNQTELIAQKQIRGCKRLGWGWAAGWARGDCGWNGAVYLKDAVGTLQTVS